MMISERVDGVLYTSITVPAVCCVVSRRQTCSMVLHNTGQVIEKIFSLKTESNIIIRGWSVVWVEFKGHGEYDMGAYFMSHFTTPSV